MRIRKGRDTAKNCYNRATPTWRKVKAMPVINTSKRTLYKVVRDNTTKSDPIYAGESPFHDDALRRHIIISHPPKDIINSMAHANSIENTWVALKQECNVAYHNWRKKHCRFYANELFLSLNGGKFSMDTQNLLVSLLKNMAGKQIIYKELVQ